MSKRVKFNEEVVQVTYEKEEMEKSNIGAVDNEEIENEDDLIKKLGKRALDIDEIEGQEEATLLSYGDIKITPFNLKEEYEEGHFDASGNYVFDKVDKDSRDAWLDSVEWETLENAEKTNQNSLKYGKYSKKSDKYSMKKAKYKKMDEDIQEKESNSDSNTSEESTKEETENKEDLLKKLIDLVNPKENVLENLKRLNKERNGLVNNKEEVIKIRAKIDAITGLADKLIEMGEYEIYHTPLNEFNKQILPENQQNDKDIEWFYKWNEDSEVYGPFSTMQMIQWNNTGYFNPFILCKSEATQNRFVKSDILNFSSYL